MTSKSSSSLDWADFSDSSAQELRGAVMAEDRGYVAEFREAGRCVKSREEGEDELEAVSLEGSSVSLSPSGSSDVDTLLSPDAGWSNRDSKLRKFIFEENVDSLTVPNDEIEIGGVNFDELNENLHHVNIYVEELGTQAPDILLALNSVPISTVSAVSVTQFGPDNVSFWIKPAFFTKTAERELKTSGVELIQTVGEALRQHVTPVEVDEGVSGGFFMKKLGGGYAGVFKPEEDIARRSCYAAFPTDGCPRNSLDSLRSDFRRGVKFHESSVREVAAYLLDHDSFVKVPETAMVKINARAFSAFSHSKEFCGSLRRSNSLDVPENDFNHNVYRRHSHWKVGSLQKFIDHDSDAYDIGCSKLDQETVQRIGLFDLRVLNTDRHEGNILIKLEEENDYNGRIDLFPIDHGFILPAFEDINSSGNFCWMNWPQSKVKFSEESKRYIEQLDADEDCEILTRLLGKKISVTGLMSLRIGTLLLKIAVSEFDLSLYEVGRIVAGQSSFDLDENKRIDSPLVTLINEAKEAVSFMCPVLHERVFIRELERRLRRYLMKQNTLSQP